MLIVYQDFNTGVLEMVESAITQVAKEKQGTLYGI